MFWSEWDGRGREDAVAVTTGWTEDEDDAKREIRRLGIHVRELRLEHGWVGSVDGDLILDACAEDGETLAELETFADIDTVVKATFAYVVVQ